MQLKKLQKQLAQMRSKHEPKIKKCFETIQTLRAKEHVLNVKIKLLQSKLGICSCCEEKDCDGSC